MIDITKLKTGDIILVDGNRWWKDCVSHLINPYTPGYHALMVFAPIRKGDEIVDWYIIESVAQGVRIGLLSHYIGKRLTVYRIVHNNYQWVFEEAIGQGLYEFTKRFSRSHYDKIAYVKLGIQVPAIILKCLVLRRRARAEDWWYKPDDKFLCTEAARRICQLAGYPIIDADTLALPNGFRQAEIEGKLNKVAEGVLWKATSYR